MVLKQLAKDPTEKQGPRTIKEAIACDEGVHIMWYAPANFVRLEFD